MKLYITVYIIICCSFTSYGESAENRILCSLAAAWNISEEQNGALLEKIVSSALMYNRSSTASARAYEAAYASSGYEALYDNPELEIEAEEFGGSGDLSGTGNSALTYRLTQKLYFGGKIGALRQVANQERQYALLSHRIRRVRIAAEVLKQFLSVITARDIKNMYEDSQIITRNISDVIAAEVNAGKQTELNLKKALVENLSAEIAYRKAEKEYEAVRKKLEVFVNASVPAAADFRKIHDMQGQLPELSLNPENCLEVILSEKEREIAKLRFFKEKTDAFPETEISVGYTRFNETDDHAFSAGFSTSLPLFKTAGQANKIASKRYEEQILNCESAILKAETELIQKHDRLILLFEEAAGYKKSILPAAEQSFETINESFIRGKSSFLDVLDAKRTLVEVRQRHIESVYEYFVEYIDFCAESGMFFGKIGGGK